MIEPIAVAALMAAAGVVVYFSTRSNQRARLRTWQAAAQKCGVIELTPSEGLGIVQHVSGRRGELSVQIGAYQHGKHTRGTQIVVSPLAAVAHLRLRVEGFGSSIIKGLRAREVELGDPDFDRRFLIEGPAPLALAVLDAPTRQEVWAAMGGQTVVDGARGTTLESQAELVNGRLTVEIVERSGVKLDEHLAGALSTILGVAGTLAVPRDVPRQLALNARSDPLWAVRLANLRTLARECPDHPETGDMLRAACGDPSEAVRLHAAVALGRDGEQTLVQLAFGDALDWTSSRAIAALGARVPADRALRALGEALGGGRVETACACIEALALDPEANAGAAEPLVLTALSNAEERVRVVAARALGRMGSVAAVPALHEAAERFGGDLRSASRQSVAEIQSRAAGATPGQLSLAAGGGGGQVSLAEAGGGEVSVPVEGDRR